MGMAGRAPLLWRDIRRFDTTDLCETFGQPWRHHPAVLRVSSSPALSPEQPIEGPLHGVYRTIETPCHGVYRRFVLLGFTRRRLWGICLASAFGASGTHRPGRLPFQSFKIGGDGGGRLRAGRVVLPEVALEPEKPCGLGHALWRLMTARAVGRVKLGGGLSLLQASLRPGRARKTQRQRTDREPDGVT
jgi:hypothetical protein